MEPEDTVSKAFDSITTSQGKAVQQSRCSENTSLGYQAVPSNQYRSRPVLKEHLANDVHRQLNCISVDWFDIGRELGVEFNYREELKRDPELTNPSRLEYVLHKWSQSECSDVNWDTIIEVLEKLQQRKVLKAVKHYLLNDLEAVRKYSWTEI